VKKPAAKKTGMSHGVEHIDVRNNPKVKKQKAEEKIVAPLA
jgi:hypothetical protein